MTATLPRLSVEYWPIEKLKYYAKNPRKNDAAVEWMCASIREYGFAVPVLARSSGEVVDGHLRLKAAKKLGMAEVPVILCDGWTEAQVKAFRLMVNRSVQWADWDPALLGGELIELKGLGFDLSLTGFDIGEIGRLTLQPDHHIFHEPCWYGVRKGRTSHWVGDAKQSTWWEVANLNRNSGNVVAPENDKSGHAAQKPVELMRRPILNHTRPGEAVYDPFLGSGTTVIAAESTERICYGLEIDPGYCDVIVARWEKLTGKKAILEKAAT